jgi:dihydroorotase
MKLLILGGRVIDPATGRDEHADLLLCDGCVAGETAGQSADRILDAAGCIVAPGLVDMHVHLREPGDEHKETVHTGTAAAVAGGFTAVACMPNTRPALDQPETIRRLLSSVASSALCRVYPIAALTVGREGRDLADYEALSAAGAVAFSDDGVGVGDAGVMAQVFRRLASLGHIAIQHCEDPSFDRGVMHDGAVSRDLGVRGISPLAEELMISRDLALCEALGASYHVAHVSTAHAIEMIRRAKHHGVQVTAEVCPHHLVLTDEDCRCGDPDFKMHPPLRPRADAQACIRGVIDGTIDLLVTDHAPHSLEEKGKGFNAAPAGVVGLETALAVFAKALVHPGHMGWPRLIELMSTSPARRFRLPGGTLAPGSPADVTIINPLEEWTIDPSEFHSKSRNCPFKGWKVQGRAVCTIVGGQIRYGLGPFAPPSPEC